MGIGSMRDRVEIQSKTRVPDNAGGFSYGWTSRGLAWGEVIAVKSSTRFMAMQLEQDISHVVRIRHVLDIVRGDRLIFLDEQGERFLEVNAVREEDNKKRWLEVLCREIKE